MHKFKIDMTEDLIMKEVLLKKLEKLSLTDSMTDLNNRRGFYQFIDYEFKQIQRSRELFAVTLCDIDFFKKVNDSYGHDCGDYVIKEVAKAIKNNIREQDSLARWGGEEFLLLQKMNLEQAAVIVERIRQDIENLDFKYNGIHISITMSFGIAQMAFDDENYEKSIIDADRKLYIAKDSGRNCIIA
ncbi:MAG: GGDEF domain-containing protein [Spirochaetaceae bacterium]|nr:GGDEF domain-containing protein [Spirochaetaceae bacterium]